MRKHRDRLTEPLVRENGTLRPIVGKQFPLNEASKAHEAVMEPGAPAAGSRCGERAPEAARSCCAGGLAA